MRTVPLPAARMAPLLALLLAVLLAGPARAQAVPESPPAPPAAAPADAAPVQGAPPDPASAATSPGSPPDPAPGTRPAAAPPAATAAPLPQAVAPAPEAAAAQTPIAPAPAAGAPPPAAATTDATAPAAPAPPAPGSAGSAPPAAAVDPVAPAAAPPAAVDPVAPSAASPASSPVPTPDAAGLAAPGVTAGSESVAGQGDAAVPAAAPPVAAPAPALPRRAAQAPPVRAHMPASAQSAPTVPVAGPADTGIVAAHAAWVDGDADRVGAYAPQVAGSLLEPYVAYWQASARLRGPNPDDSAVRPFLARYPGTVLADRLRADWLMALATRGDFATFDAERRRLVLGGDDAQLACYTLLARYLVDDGHRREAISREARRTLSLTSDPGGDGCTALAERLLDDGLLSIWPRLQALVERNQFPAATAAAQRLPPADAAAVKALVQNPAAWLAAARLDQMPHALPLLAIVALARDAPDRAAVYADRLDPTLTPEERAVAWGRIGRSAQHSLAPQAHAWFERGGELVGLGLDYVRGPDVLETRVRAALRRGAGATVAETYAVSGVTARALPAPSISTPIEADQGAAGPTGPDWAAVRRGIAHMSAEQQADSTWIYWNAQAAIALGQVEEGRAALQSIADRFSFYGRLAAEQLGLPMRLPARPETAPDAVIEQLALRPGFQRARKLYELGLRDEGNREWNWELRGMDDVYLHASAELARRLGVLDRMIASSERTRAVVDIDQRYPMPYRDFMTATAAPLGVDAAWIYGLIRQESRFMEDIRSNAGAVGLMQLMPATARFVARRIGFDHYRAERIGEVNVNLRLGTEYLKLVSDDQDGQPMLASAAYNAGPNRVRKWRAALARPLDGAIFAETIPISETRDYVKKVLFNTVVYGAMLDRPAVSLRALLPPVSPKGIPATDLP